MSHRKVQPHVSITEAACLPNPREEALTVEHPTLYINSVLEFTTNEVDESSISRVLQERCHRVRLVRLSVGPFKAV